MARVLRYTIAGTLGAVFGWVIMEPTPLMPNDDRGISYAATFAVGLISGLMIGLMMGLAEAARNLSAREARRSILSGALIGAAGGILGLTFGQAFYNVMYNLAGAGAPPQHLPGDIPVDARLPSEPAGGVLSFFLLLIGRGFGWALIGGFIGLSQGIATSSSRKMINGAVGGFIGGGIGGTVFQILVFMNQPPVLTQGGGAIAFPPQMIRFISFAVTGLCIGLFLGFVAEIARRAWLIRLVGRNEGKEYVIHKPVTVMGRSELVDVPVYGDPDVVEKHASITLQGSRHVIEDMGSYSGTFVNGSKVTREILRDGDTVTIGKTRFLFRDKASARSDGARPSAYDQGARIPTSQHICPFCGAIKDASGNCDCSVNGAPPAPPQGVSAPQPTVQDPFRPAPPQPTVQQPSQPTQVSGGGGQFEPTLAQPAQAQGARLTALSGPYSGQTFPLRSGETAIGREASRDIGLPMDNTVSRTHVRITQEVTCFVLHDAGSTNGTFVNGARVTRHELKPGDVIQIGSTKFRFDG